MHHSFPARPVADQDAAASFTRSGAPSLSGVMSGRLPPQEELGAMLVRLRAQAGLTQREVADRLGVHQTCVSRMERGRRGVDASLLRRYLRMVADPEAIRLLDAARSRWVHLPRPPLRHPELGLLHRIEDALLALRGGEEAPPGGLEGLLGHRLHRMGEALGRMDHRVVFLGEAGGPARRIALAQSGLPPREEGAAPGLDCELEIRPGEGFALRVMPVEGQALRRHVADFCHAVTHRLEWLSGDARATSPGLPPGLEGCLRNLAGLALPPARAGALQDPAAALARDLAPARFETEVLIRMGPWRRLRRHLAFDGTEEEEGRRWLAGAIAAVLAGRHAEAPLPARLEATVPARADAGARPGIAMLAAAGLRGPDPSPALLAHFRDPRTLVVLCPAGGQELSPLLAEALRRAAEAGVDPMASGRILLSGAGAEDAEGAGRLAEAISGGIDAIRARWRAEAATALDAVPEGPAEEGVPPSGLRDLLAPAPWTADLHVPLLQAVRSSPLRVLARTVRASGRLPELDFAACLAGEAVRQAARRSFDATRVLRKHLAGRTDALGTLLGGAIAEWEGEFLLAVRYHVETAYREALDRERSLWDEAVLAGAEAVPLRQGVSAGLEAWFGRNDALRRTVEEGIGALWQGIVARRVSDGLGGADGSPGGLPRPG